MFPMTLGTQEKHDILLMIKATAKKTWELLFPENIWQEVATKYEQPKV